MLEPNISIATPISRVASLPFAMMFGWIKKRITHNKERILSLSKYLILRYIENANNIVMIILMDLDKSSMIL